MRMLHKDLAFTLEEYSERLENLRSRMSEKGIDCMLVHTPENICYLTGHQSPGYYMYLCLVVPQKGNPALVLRRGELGNASVYAWLPDLIAYDDTDDPCKATVDAVKKVSGSPKTVGVEFDAWFLGQRRFLALKDGLTDSKLVDGGGIVESMRVVKSPKELEYIHKAARAAETAMRLGIEAAVPGATENDIATAMFRGLIQEGSEYLAMEPFVASGPRSSIMHSPWSGRVLEKGDLILLEVAGCSRRYHAALMRTVSLGKPSERTQRFADICIESLNRAIGAIRPGVTSGEVDEACRGYIEDSGVEEFFRKRTGYSIGIAFAPDWGEGHILSLSKDNPATLKEGMTFHMPPALRDFGQIGVGFSETVAVGKSGCEVITSFPRELAVK
jgi:Xaa-Pro dipeptidase